jgi:hypothetical protein
MSRNVSPQVRVLALVGVLVTLALALGLRMLSPGGSPTAAHRLKPLHQRTQNHRAAPTRKAHSPAKPNSRSTLDLDPIVRASGLPPTVARALLDHHVVVVSLFSPRAKVDGTALSEARAGAEAADAGFVRINVLRQREIAALNAKLGVMYDPTVLVFRRPYELFVQLDGFADRETVAQAATDAARPGEQPVG